VAAASGFSTLKGGLLLPIVDEKGMDWKSKKLQKPVKKSPKLWVLASTGSLSLDQPYRYIDRNTDWSCIFLQI
jgi:hypothetical protein